MSTKTCKKCGETKPLIAFHQDSGKADGRRTVCKACCSKYATERNKAKREAAAAGEKTCARCRKTKPLSEFNRRSRARNGYRSRCRDCENQTVPLVRPWDRTAVMLLQLFLRDVERGRLKGLADIAQEMHRPLAEVEEWAGKIGWKGAGRCG